MDIGGTVQAVADQLRQMGTGLDRAEGGLGAAEASAGRIASTAARSGFAAVAVQLRALADRIGRARIRVVGVHTSVDQLRAAVDGVPRQGTPKDVVTVVTPLIARASKVAAENAAVLQELQKVEAAVAKVLQGGQPQQLIAQLQPVRQVLAAVGQGALGGRRTLEGLIGQARRVGDSGAPVVIDVTGGPVPGVVGGGGTPTIHDSAPGPASPPS